MFIKYEDKVNKKAIKIVRERLKTKLFLITNACNKMTQNSIFYDYFKYKTVLENKKTKELQSTKNHVGWVVDKINQNSIFYDYFKNKTVLETFGNADKNKSTAIYKKPRWMICRQNGSRFEWLF